jgi:hypothetical protein
MRPIAITGLMLTLFFCLPAAAQTSCPATPTFTVTSTNPVMLTISHATTRNLSGPSVQIAGNVVTIRQIDFSVPPPPGPAGSTPCNNLSVSLGTLPPGNYIVRWHYSVVPALPGGGFGDLESFTFAFTHGLVSVPAVDGPALFGLMLLLGTLGVVLLRR